MQRVPGLPEDLPRGRKVELQILSCDLVDLVMDAKLLKVLDESLSPEDEAAFEAELADAMPESDCEASSEEDGASSPAAPDAAGQDQAPTAG